jgi:hypothetical protein
MPKVLVEWWYYESCPLAETCTAASWKRAKCSSKLEAGARLALKHHLVNSSNHELHPDKADRVIRRAVLKHEQYYENAASDETQGDEKGDNFEDDKKTARVEDGEKTARVEDEKRKAKVEELEEQKSRNITLCPNNKRKLDDSIQEVKSEVSSEEEKSDDDDKTSSVVSCENKMRKLNDSDLDKLLFEAANKVQKGLECVAVAQQNMEEAKDALRKIQAVVDKISKSRGPPDVD